MQLGSQTRFIILEESVLPVSFIAEPIARCGAGARRVLPLCFRE
jgi:hypothetical protein